MGTQRLTGGQVLVRALVGEGVDVVFGLPGVQLDWLFDALYAERERIRVYHTRHEQATAYMADGYARTTGRVGVCTVVPGPGLLNAGAALATAYACSARVLCITGQVDSRAIDCGYGLLHEIPHQDAVLSAFTKWTGRAMAPSQIPDLVRQAFSELRSGRPRPVAVEVPPDVLQRVQDVQLLEPPDQLQRAEDVPGPPDVRRRAQDVPGPPDVRRRAQDVHVPSGVQGRAQDVQVLDRSSEETKKQRIDQDKLRQAAELLHAAERPVIYSGGGTLAAEAWGGLQSLAEILEAPVVMSVDGRGALSDRHDLAHTGVTGQALVREADVVLGVGTRFWQPARVWGFASGAKVIRIDVDPAEIDRLGSPDVGIVGDAKAVLTGLNEILNGTKPRPSRRAELRARKDAATAHLSTFQPQAAFAAAIRAALPDDGITVNDLTQVTFFNTVGFPVYQPRTLIGPGYQGTLGSAFATALGAQVGNPDRAVVAIAGDGGFMYSVAELATQCQHGLNVVSIVFNDGAFGNVKRTQEQTFAGRLIASDLVNPDFVALARSFGIDGERVTTPAQLEAALRSALAGRAPALIEVAVGPMSNVWPVIGPAGGVYPIMLEPPNVS